MIERKPTASISLYFLAGAALILSAVLWTAFGPGANWNLEDPAVFRRAMAREYLIEVRRHPRSRNQYLNYFHTGMSRDRVDDIDDILSEAQGMDAPTFQVSSERLARDLTQYLWPSRHSSNLTAPGQSSPEGPGL